MHAAFYAAAQQKPRVLGLPLREFTIGHARLLWEIQSPYVTHERTPTVSDFVLASFICHHGKSDQARKEFTCWWFSIFVWLWGKVISRKDLVSENELFETYLSDAHTRPALNPFKSCPFQDAATPPIYQLITILMQRLHQPLSEIDAMPFRLATGLYSTWGDVNGLLPVLSDREASFVEFAREQDRLKFGKGAEN